MAVLSNDVTAQRLDEEDSVRANYSVVLPRHLQLPEFQYEVCVAKFMCKNLQTPGQQIVRVFDATAQTVVLEKRLRLGIYETEGDLLGEIYLQIGGVHHTIVQHAREEFYVFAFRDDVWYTYQDFSSFAARRVSRIERGSTIALTTFWWEFNRLGSYAVENEIRMYPSTGPAESQKSIMTRSMSSYTGRFMGKNCTTWYNGSNARIELGTRSDQVVWGPSHMYLVISEKLAHMLFLDESSNNGIRGTHYDATRSSSAKGLILEKFTREDGRVMYLVHENSPYVNVYPRHGPDVRKYAGSVYLLISRSGDSITITLPDSSLQLRLCGENGKDEATLSFAGVYTLETFCRFCRNLLERRKYPSLKPPVKAVNVHVKGLNYTTPLHCSKKPHRANALLLTNVPLDGTLIFKVPLLPNRIYRVLDDVSTEQLKVKLVDAFDEDVTPRFFVGFTCVELYFREVWHSFSRPGEKRK